MHCIRDNSKQKIFTAVKIKNVIQRLSKKNYKHSILNKLNSRENFLKVLFILDFNKVYYNV